MPQLSTDTGFEHPALLHSTLDAFLQVMVPFVNAGLRTDEPVFVAVGAERLRALRDLVGEHDGVVWNDTLEWHPQPMPRLRAFTEYVTEQLAAGAPRLRLVGEPVWSADAPEDVREWQRYESVLNDVLSPYPVSLVCTYDAATLPSSIVEVAKVTHPVVRLPMEVHSAVFEPPSAFLGRWTHDLEPPPADAPRIMSPFELSAARRFLKDRAHQAGVPADRITDLMLAANEILTNGLVHGTGTVTLSAWTNDGAFVCQIEDEGAGPEDPVAGYLPPSDETRGGRGLWIARQLVDLVQISTGPDRATVRLLMRRSAA